jgi:hypothetical protein
LRSQLEQVDRKAPVLGGTGLVVMENSVQSGLESLGADHFA